MVTTTGVSQRRRSVLALVGAAIGAFPLLGMADPAVKRIRPKVPPVWTGFGLNGSAGQGRYDLTREYVRRHWQRSLTDSNAFAFLRDPLAKLLQDQHPPVAQFKRSIEFGEDLLLGFAHDFEATVGARIEKDGQNANTLIVYMSGVGLVLAFDTRSGWRILSSFPFMMRMERPGGDLKDVRDRALAYLGEAYSSYAAAFASYLGRFDRWQEGFSSNFFARLTKATVHQDAAAKLVRMKVDKVLTPELIGFSTSSALCDHLNIPLLPYQDNDALAKRYSVKFADDLAAQQELVVPDADLRFEVVLRDVDKQLIHSSQRGVTIIRRTAVVRLIVFDEFSDLPEKKLLNVLAQSTGEDRMPLHSVEDDTPERDLVFYDRLVTRTLANLLRGLATNDEHLLASAEVRLSFVAPAQPRLMELCAKTRT